MQLKVGDAKVNKTGTCSPEVIIMEDVKTHWQVNTQYGAEGWPFFGEIRQAK